MAFNRDHAVVLLFGGADERQVLADLWAWDGDAWHQIHMTTPSARAEASMAFDSDRQRIVLYGGHDGDRVFGDTWEWNGHTWLQKTERVPRRRVDNRY